LLPQSDELPLLHFFNRRQRQSPSSTPSPCLSISTLLKPLQAKTNLHYPDNFNGTRLIVKAAANTRDVGSKSVEALELKQLLSNRQRACISLDGD
jgi:hypothetical protein